MKYTTKIILKDRKLDRKINFLIDVTNLEKENKVKTIKKVSRIDGIEIYVPEMNQETLFELTRNLSSKYGNVYASIDNESFNDCTIYKFSTGKIVERDYFKHLA